MPFTNTKQGCLKTLAIGWTLVRCQLTVGATGAVSAVSGKGFNNGAATGDLGGFTRNSAGDYTITLPGSGGFQAIIPLSVQIIDSANTDVRFHRWDTITPSARTAQVAFSDADTPAATDPGNGSVIEFVFLVDDSTVD